MYSWFSTVCLQSETRGEFIEGNAVGNGSGKHDGTMEGYTCRAAFAEMARSTERAALAAEIRDLTAADAQLSAQVERAMEASQRRARHASLLAASRCVGSQIRSSIRCRLGFAFKRLHLNVAARRELDLSVFPTASDTNLSTASAMPPPRRKPEHRTESLDGVSMVAKIVTSQAMEKNDSSEVQTRTVPLVPSPSCLTPERFGAGLRGLSRRIQMVQQSHRLSDTCLRPAASRQHSRVLRRQRKLARTFIEHQRATQIS